MNYYFFVIFFVIQFSASNDEGCNGWTGNWQGTWNWVGTKEVDCTSTNQNLTGDSVLMILTFSGETLKNYFKGTCKNDSTVELKLNSCDFHGSITGGDDIKVSGKCEYDPVELEMFKISG